jgi:CheY-like chemotaxis protein
MLQTIQGTAEMALLALEKGSPYKESFLQIQQAAEKCSELTRQLLAFARRQTVTPRVVDLNDAVVGLLRMLRRLLGEDIEMTWNPGRNLWPTKIDPSQLDQILANLAVNARDAIGAEGRITIETENLTLDSEYCRSHSGFQAGDYVCLTVSDNGCGMEEETLDYIFEPFFTTKGPEEGTGLGLATVYGIVRQNGGFIHAYSELGKGTSFKIYLPRFVGAIPAKESAIGPPVPRGIETVLVAEDDPAILRITQRMLEELGYTVIAAVSGSAAIDLLEQREGPIHLLLTDVVMPDMNGRQLHGEVVERCPAIRTMYMSGYTANVIAHHGVLDEGVHFIQKPFSIRQLGEAVRAALDGRL